MKRATTPRDKTSTKQDYRTPAELIEAVQRRFGKIRIDLAASDGHEVIPGGKHITPEEDSLSLSWSDERITSGVLWLNPPFRDIAPWAAKCADWRHIEGPGPVLALLVPASVDSNWWLRSVRHQAIVYALAPRVTFQGETQPYPKACSLCIYDPRHDANEAVHLWRWK